MTDRVDAEAIAAGLSEAQRELCVLGGRCVRTYRPAMKLVALGLWADSVDEFTIVANWTPLGLAVRDVLMKEKG